jgi:hypothetical protein
VGETLDYLLKFARLPAALQRYLDSTVTADNARAIVRDRLEERSAMLVALVDRCVYGLPRSPYRRLLEMAGCELGDFQRLVAGEGVEGALLELRRNGVYVTYEEFKGRRHLVRGAMTVPVNATDFDNPFARRDLTARTGGSTGLASPVPLGLDYFAARAHHQALIQSAYGLDSVPTAYWLSILPGSGFQFILQRTDLREPLHRWFSMAGWRDSDHWIRYGLATLYLLFWLRALGAKVPMPEVVRLADADVVVRWMLDACDAHGGCLLHTNPSHALRVAVAAEESGIDLTGATVRIGGEPLTAAKLEAMQGVGLRVIPAYGMTETSTSAIGCAMPAAPDDLHLLTDAFALVTHPLAVGSLAATVPAWNLTALLDTSPKVMLNVQIDDYGTVEQRHCGCPLESYGYTTHVHGIGSYSKLVGEGITLIGNDVQHILEHTLPARFGGSALDFQLLEEEDERGFTRAYLVVHPRVQIADEAALLTVVLDGLRRASPMADAARMVWEQAGTLRVRRAEPLWTAAGKLLPLRVATRSAARGGERSAPQELERGAGS